MAHSERLPECEELRIRIDEHLRNAPDRETRLATLELRMDLIEKQVMKNAIIGGIVGALIGSGAAPAINQLVSFILKG